MKLDSPREQPGGRCSAAREHHHSCTDDVVITKASYIRPHSTRVEATKPYRPTFSFIAHDLLHMFVSLASSGGPQLVCTSSMQSRHAVLVRACKRSANITGV
jgi:hypothetical protein